MKHEHIYKKKRKTNSRLTNRTLIHVLVAGTSHKAGRTGADSAAIKGVGITNRTLVARVTHTCIVEVAQQTCEDSAKRIHMTVINNQAAIHHPGLIGPQEPFDKPTYPSFQVDTGRRRMLHGHGRWHH